MVYFEKKKKKGGRKPKEQVRPKSKVEIKLSKKKNFPDKTDEIQNPKNSILKNKFYRSFLENRKERPVEDSEFQNELTGDQLKKQKMYKQEN